jgi:hypothetical protein
MNKILILLLVLGLVSCSSITGKKKTEQPVRSAKGEKVQETGDPKPGDVMLVDGVEFIYARNRQFMNTPHDPEYMWIRKDQYSPGIFESLAGKVGGASKKEREELEKRMAKLEEDLKKKGAGSSRPAYAVPQQTLPGAFSAGMVPGISFAFPSPKMKRRVLVLPFVDQTNYKDEHLDELATRRLISRLENTGAIICVDPSTVNFKGDVVSPSSITDLGTAYGVHAVVKANISDVYTSTSKVEGRGDGQTSIALSKITLDVYNTETGKLLRHLTGRNPVFLTREQGDMSSEKAKVKAIDLAIELIADDLLRSVLSLDWYSRIASLEKEKVFIGAGRLSGLEKGDILEVYTRGEQVIDKTTNTPLGRIKGDFKGELEVLEVFGVDASWAKPKKGGSFAPADLVYFKK